MDDGRPGARGFQPQPRRLPRLNLRGTCSSGGSHVVSFVWRAGVSRDPHSRPRRRPGGRAGLAPRYEPPPRPPAAAWRWAGAGARAWGRAGEFGAEPSYPELRIGPATPASRRLLAPRGGDGRGAAPAHLPAPPPTAGGKPVFAAHGRVAPLRRLVVPSRTGEGSEAVLALIPGSLDQPAGEAGAGSAPPRRGLPGGRGPSPALLLGMLGAPGDAGAQAPGPAWTPLPH